MKAMVCTEPGKYSVEDVTLDPPKAGEVRVKMGATGVCHSDLSVINGILPLPPPVVLGHEGAGVVEELGEGLERRLCQAGAAWIDPDREDGGADRQRLAVAIVDDTAIGRQHLPANGSGIALLLQKRPLGPVEVSEPNDHGYAPQGEASHQRVVPPAPHGSIGSTRSGKTIPSSASATRSTFK